MKKLLISLAFLAMFAQSFGQTDVLNVSADTLQSWHTYYVCSTVSEVRLWAQDGCDDYYWGYDLHVYYGNPMIITRNNAGAWTYDGCNIHVNDANIVFASELVPTNYWSDTTFICPGQAQLFAQENPQLGYRYSFDGLPFDTIPYIWCNPGEHHTVKIIDACGNTIEDSTYIVGYPEIIPHFDSESIYICPEENLELKLEDDGDMFVAYEWSTGAHTPSIIVNDTGYYFVQTVDIYGCTGFAGVDVRFLPFQNPNSILLFPTVDTLTNNNMFVWQTSNPNASQLVAYRETTTNNYQLVGEVPFEDGSFVDDVSSVERTYRYKFALKDRCGNESPKGQSYQPMSAQYMGPGTTSWWIQWTPLKISNVGTAVDHYEVRSLNDREDLGAAALVDGEVYYDDFFDYYYMNLPNGMSDSLLCVKAYLKAEYGGGISTSNIVLNIESVDGVGAVAAPSLSVCPNPADGRFTVTGTGHADIYDVMGQKVGGLEVDGQALVELPAGIYLVRLGDKAVKVVVR